LLWSKNIDLSIGLENWEFLNFLDLVVPLNSSSCFLNDRYSLLLCSILRYSSWEKDEKVDSQKESSSSSKACMFLKSYSAYSVGEGRYKEDDPLADCRELNLCLELELAQ
jgi:hypothetical protein